MKLRRRRVPRQSADWFGKCLVDDDPEGAWYECRVVDVSILGAGIEVFGFTGRVTVGQRLVLEVQTPEGDSVTVHLVGEVKNVGSAPRGRLRIGVEFTELSDGERSIVGVIQRMRMAW
ncbi:MAG TPA: PilZ domain-containing protein [Acidimicrobiales bacterium]